MRKYIVWILLLLVSNVTAFSQVTESRFYFRTIRDSSLNQIADGLSVEPWKPEMNFTTKAEGDDFFQLYYKASRSGNLEIVKIDSSDFTLRFTNLNEDGFYFHEINQVYSERSTYNNLASFHNTTNDTIYIPTRFNILYAIIEAKDCEGSWRPIQYCNNCGMGDHMMELRLYPNQTLRIPINSNFGPKAACMRLKLHGNDTIYVSNEFNGTVNDRSFFVPKALFEKCEYVDPFLNEVIYSNLEEEVEYEFTEILE